MRRVNTWKVSVGRGLSAAQRLNVRASRNRWLYNRMASFCRLSNPLLRLRLRLQRKRCRAASVLRWSSVRGSRSMRLAGLRQSLAHPFITLFILRLFTRWSRLLLL